MGTSIRRHLVQLCVSLLYNINLNTEFQKNGFKVHRGDLCVPALNCQYCQYSVAGCPLGLAQQDFAGTFGSLAWKAWGIMVLCGLLLGRIVCGWLCPVGLLQDLLDKVPLPKLKKSKVTYYLSYVKYVIGAVFVIGIPLYTAHFGARGITAFCTRICPNVILEAMILPALVKGRWDIFLTGWSNTRFVCAMILVVIMLFVYRPFCRFICPLGAFYGFFNKVSVLGMKVDHSKCVNCNLCVKQCKMDIKQVGDHECIACGNCIDKCPVQAIEFKKLKLR